MTTEKLPSGGKRKPSGWLNVLVDYGPLLIFLATYKIYAPAEKSTLGEVGAVMAGTVAFMISAVIALAFSKWRFGRVSPMLLLSTALIMVFGGFTLWTGEQWVIQIKPTAIYVLFGSALIVGWLRGRAFLQVLLSAAFEGLDKTGWLKLSRNWGFFFFVLAALNETLRRTLTFEDWLWAKLWVFMPISFLFTFTQIPMLLRHGLATEGLKEEEKTPPPTS